ncbi:TIR domain-containing protein [Fluviicoccus keumensis]|uniref:TIR domain-containing protein n=1 Tax=Fluviicoccus keumensis TaxID=1435465 RepID=A0A4Q7ZBI6_9GAMM|nr:toll/interleukin-1 receptor domain-containing protein [Fluviicoccus keumensis]RZU47958.1 TIR domain-containing protein [Fluviicoccus keumensis]
MSFMVFMSYATADISVAKQLKTILESSSVSVFVSEFSLSAGEPLIAGIDAKIMECNLFLLLWSHNSKCSDWVQQEIGIAKAYKKQILPVVLEKNLSLPAFIKDIKYLPIYDSPQEMVVWLRNNIYAKANAKERDDGLFWLTLGIGLLALTSRS